MGYVGHGLGAGSGLWHAGRSGAVQRRAGRTTVSAQYPRFRQVLDRFAPYKAGVTPPPEPGRRSFKLSSNESPYGPLPSVLKVITEAATGVNRYPDNMSEGLTEAIAARYGVPA